MIRSGLLLGLALALALPAGVAGQRGGPQFLGPGSFQIGGRLGYDFDSASGALMLGAGSRITLPGLPRFELQAVGDLTFLDGLVERQFNGDLLYRTRGFALGGGIALRNTIWTDSPDRETRTGYSLVAIFGGQASNSLLATQLELRYTNVSEFAPQTASLGISIPIFRY